MTDGPLNAALLLDWYTRHHRRLPWRVGPAERARGIRPDPYRTWLSEVMLQQTTVQAVKGYFETFTTRWPTVEALAAAPREAVMAAWAGLGYYARARNLKACAETVAGLHGGRFPGSEAELAALPGIGAYTAAAVAALAFDRPAAVVDGNVERVVTRLHALDRPLPGVKAEVRALVAAAVPGDRPGEFAEAMMDLGATICTPRRPSCGLCPLAAACAARIAGTPERFPVKADKPQRPERHGTAFAVVRADGALLLARRPDRGLLGGMAELPSTPFAEKAAPAGGPPLRADFRTLGTVTHVFTHFRLTLTVRRADVAMTTPAPAGHWWSPDPSADGLPSVMAKAAALALGKRPDAGGHKGRLSRQR